MSYAGFIILLIHSTILIGVNIDISNTPNYDIVTSAIVVVQGAMHCWTVVSY